MSSPDHQTVHHDLNVVLLVLFQLNLLAEIIGDAIHPAADVARLAGVLEDLGVLPFLPRITGAMIWMRVASGSAIT